MSECLWAYNISLYKHRVWINCMFCGILAIRLAYRDGLIHYKSRGVCLFFQVSLNWRCDVRWEFLDELLDDGRIVHRRLNWMNFELVNRLRMLMELATHFHRLNLGWCSHDETKPFSFWWIWHLWSKMKNLVSLGKKATSSTRWVWSNVTIQCST